MPKFPNLKPYTNQLDIVKGDLLTLWISHETIQGLLKTYNIPPEFFSRYFGKKIIEYAFDVLRGEHPIGNCPIIGVMLVYFEKKNFALEDIFELCSHLKNAMLECALNHAILTNATIQEISLMMDKNLKGVIREYMEIYYNAQPQQLSCPLAPPPGVQKIFTDNIQLSPKEDTTSALHYLQEIEVDFDLLDELNEIETETFSSLHLSETMTASTYPKVIFLFGDYMKVLNQLIEFNAITYSLSMLIDLLQNKTIDSIGKEHIETITIYIKAILSDLSMWRKSVFIDQSAEDIHYLDKTLLSSITQLQIMLSEDDGTMNYEIEFF